MIVSKSSLTRNLNVGKSRSGLDRLSGLAAIITMMIVVAGADLVGAQAALAEEGIKECSDPTQPCFANNKDILGRRRHILRTDDLVVSRDHVFLSGSTTNSLFENFLLFTDKLSVTHQLTYDVVTVPCHGDSQVPASIVTRVGRVFDLKNDVIVSLVPRSTLSGTNCDQGYTELNIANPNSPGISVAVTGMGYKAEYTSIALEDFNFDGFADIFLIGPFFKPSFNPILEVYTALDVKDFSKGLTPKDSLVPANQDNTLPRSEVVTGDFNGDGILDVAWVGGAYRGELEIYFASICPAAGVKVLQVTCPGPFKPILSTQTIKTGIIWKFDSEGFFPQISLSAGDFDGVTNSETGIVDDELLFLLRKIHPASYSATLEIDAFNFKPDFEAIKAPETLSLDPLGPANANDGPAIFAHPTSRFHVASGRLDWNGSREQVVVGASGKGISAINGFSLYGVYTITFSTKDGNDLFMTSHGQHQVSGANIFGDIIIVEMIGLTIGRFNPPNQDDQIDFNQQIAVLYQEKDFFRDSNADTHVDIVTVAPKAKDGFAPKFHSLHVLSYALLYSDGLRVRSPIQVGDLRGTSLALGPPQVLKVAGHIDPSIVLGMPPMHADYIARTSENSPSIVNVSIDPADDTSTSEEADFNATYTFSDSSSTNTTRQNTTSSTLSTKESVEGKVSFELAVEVAVTVKASAQQFFSKNVSKKHVFKTTNTQKEQATTGLGDLVWYGINDLYIYSYPVIGHTICPGSKPNCSSSEKLPLHIQFSGPDVIKTNIASAAGDLMVMQGHNMEWYQPVHEPGNLLSYPWNENLLKDRLRNQNPNAPAVQQLANSPSQTVDGHAAINQTSWSETTTASTSTGSASKFSEDASISVAAKGVFNSGQFSIDVKGSDSTKTLTTTISTISSSEGIEVKVPAFDSLGDWAVKTFPYTFESYIFGQDTPKGTLDDVKVPAELSTNGAQRTSYVAVATATNWFLSYNLPDLALNHPERWSWDSTSLEATFNPPIMTEVDTSPFYAMRGFFVTAQDATGATPIGPMFTQLTAGEVLTLWTRVYNMSLTAFKDTETAYVRIYGQVFNVISPTCQQIPQPDNCQFVGPSFEVGTQHFNASFLNSYPDHDADINQNPNWLMVKQDWSTEPDPDNPMWGCGPIGNKESCTGKELVFWVLVWPEANGVLAGEMVGHGLSQIPSDTLNNITDVPLEKVLYDNEMQTFSNNVGLYNQTFYVCDPAAECGTPNEALAVSSVAATAGSKELIDNLLVDEVMLANKSVDLHDSIRVDARIATTEQLFAPINVFFYDGDPNDDERIPFDHEHIPFVGSNSKYITSSRFQPKVCGSHEIHVVIAAAGRAPVTNLTRINVTADPVAEVDLIAASVERIGLRQGLENSLLTKLQKAKSRFAKDSLRSGINKLNAFRNQVMALSGGKIPVPAADSLITQVDRLVACM